ncbi:MAG: hypothetical protein ACE5I7_00265 [Candidatus Binatia bacterium]
MKRGMHLGGAIILSGVFVISIAACTPSPRLVEMNPPTFMMRMMGMGDMADALGNVNELIPMAAHQRQALIAKTQAETLRRGNEIFHDKELGNSGLACASCHPNGGTTGGEAQLPMTEFRVPIPDLHGAAATFPKFKVPSGRVITLEQMDTNCLRMFVMGRGLSDEDSDALAMYVTSFSKGEQVQVGSK